MSRCDADPEVLSDYVLALLKHDEPEPKLRAGLERQLNEFLEAGWFGPYFQDGILTSLVHTFRSAIICRQTVPHNKKQVVYAL